MISTLTGSVVDIVLRFLGCRFGAGIITATIGYSPLNGMDDLLRASDVARL